VAELVSFPTGNVPTGFVDPGFNSAAVVQVQDSPNGSPITNASVSVNGMALAYYAAQQDYEGEIVVAPGGSVTLDVTVGGTTYTTSGTQFTAYPTIVNPQANATWLSSASNLAAWSGVLPTASSFYALGVLDSSSGQLAWPSGNAFDILPTTTTSYTFNPGALTTGSRFVFVGIGTALSIPNAASGSGMIIAGFNYVSVTISSTPPPSLSSIAVTPQNPTLGKGKTLQLTATGTYSDTSTQDLTTQVTWTSSDTAEATVGAAGLATGVNFGQTTVTAALGAVSGSATATVFQPTPSPSPPLSQSVAYQIDYAHSGYAVFADPVTFPGSPAWSVTLNAPVSYPLIAGGEVFVTTQGPETGPAALYALNQQTGSIVWGPIALPGTYNWSKHAYDNGKIFVINTDGLLRSFDAATGQAGWSTQLRGQNLFESAPTAANGIVYVDGAGEGATLYAVDESNGNVLWTASVNGTQSSPAVSSDGVFVTFPCQAYKFDPITGSALWHYDGGCEGGGGEAPAYANGLLYMRNPPNPPGLIFDAATGALTGSFTATPIPAFSTQTGFFLVSYGALTAIDLSTNNVLWSFTGDGALALAPIVINQVVVVGSTSGNVYALDAATGSLIWSGSAGSGIGVPDENNGEWPLTGFGAGEGYLVVPAGNVLTAWHISGP
jgi:outer membrane protein assembly factor BamB